MRRFIAGCFVLALMVAGGHVASAQVGRTELDIRNAPPAPRVYLREEPRFIEVAPDENVYRLENVPGDYELYRYGGHYYVYSNGYWYRGENYRGPFYVMRERFVPDVVYSAVVGSDNDRVVVSNAPPAPRVYFGGGADFVLVPGTSVYRVENTPGNYEIFRYNGTYYMLNSGYWYRASSASGPYDAVREGSVPASVMAAADYRWSNGSRTSVDIRNAPLPPRIYVTRAPMFDVIPGTTVYRWDQHPGSYELYRYRDTYYLMSNGYWYSSSSYRGPFSVVQETVVPRPVFMATSYHARHVRVINRAYYRGRGRMRRGG